MKPSFSLTMATALALGLTLGACSNDGDTTRGAAQPGDTAARDIERTSTQAGRTPARLAAKRPDVREFRIGSGTEVELRNSVELSSRDIHRGAAVTATAARAVYSSRGDTVIQAGAEFVGRVTAIAPAERPGLEGTMRLDFDSVRINGRTFAISARTSHIATVMKGPGVTTGDIDIVLPVGGTVHIALTRTLDASRAFAQ